MEKCLCSPLPRISPDQSINFLFPGILQKFNRKSIWLADKFCLGQSFGENSSTHGQASRQDFLQASRTKAVYVTIKL